MNYLPCIGFLAALTLLPISAAASSFADSLEGKLVRLEDGKLKSVPKGHLAQKKVIALYYSAHWCPPCRAFTPDLSKEYVKLAAEHPEFELIFISSDRNEKAMQEYMAWGSMTYPALEFGAQQRNKKIAALAARGIPYLVVVDADGKELAGKGKQDWVHPSEIIPRLKKILASSDKSSAGS